MALQAWMKRVHREVLDGLREFLRERAVIASQGTAIASA
jgi:hypothetical protein